MIDITIPPKALEALAMTIYDITGEGIDMEEARSACLAMLKAWPGMMHIIEGEPGRENAEIILPLTETTNDKA